MQRLKAAYPAMGIVLLSAYEYYLDEVMAMLNTGMVGIAYKLKGRRSKLLLEAIYRVLEGHVEIDAEVRAKKRFNLADDIGEKKNLAAQYPAKVEELSGVLRRIREHGRTR